MVQSRLFGTPALLACVIVCASLAHAAESDPKAVAVEFSKAVMVGDKKAAHDVCVGSPEQLATIDTMIDAMSALTKFKDACEKQFGPDNILSKNMMGGMPNMADEAAKEDYPVVGDVATAVDKAHPDKKNPMKLKKADGKWKVDLASMGDDAAETAKAMGPIAKIFGEFAADITAGKYKTAGEVAIAIQAKMQGGGK